MNYRSISAFLNQRTMPYSNTMQGLSQIRNSGLFTTSAQDIASAVTSGEKIDYASQIGEETLDAEGFRNKIDEIISSFERHPTRENSASAIHITDDAFDRMMGDRDYTNWVLNKIRDEFATADPKIDAFGGAFDLKYFGAAISNYSSDFWYAGLDSQTNQYNWDLFNTKSKGSFWQTSTSNMNMKAAQLLAQAQTKQAQMAAQAQAAQAKAAQDAKEQTK